MFNKKLNIGGKVEKYKAHLVGKGYSQVEGICFDKIFSHVSKLNYNGFLYSIDSTLNREVVQMVVDTPFFILASSRGNLHEKTIRICIEGK